MIERRRGGVQHSHLALENARRTLQAKLSRRTALECMGIGLGLLAGCSDDGDGSGASAGTGGADGSGGSGGSSGSTAAGGNAAGGDAAGGDAGAGSATAWATGGTAAMLAAASYPDPFEAVGTGCALTCVLTQGPCWAPTAPVRQDISEGEPGVPLRLMLRVLDADGCTPVSGAEVEIWYCNIDGLYSAEDVQSASFCTSEDEHALSSYFFRGRAIADAAGKVTFDGCFPGWYPSRSVHIHVLVRPASNAGESSTGNAIAISQLFFPETLTQEIFESVAGYIEHGQPDTSFDADNVLTSVEDITPYVVDYERMSDGALLAWKDLVISSTDSCGSSGGGPGGAPPGAPPG